MKSRTFFLALLLCLLLLSGCATKASPKRLESLALQRVEQYMEAFNRGGKEPEGIYPFLCSEYKAQISEEAFLEAYLKDRSYPYITPFYVFEPEITFSDDMLSGTVVFQQAARIVGMTWTVSFVFENGSYYFKDWDYLIDGSYLEKFEDIPYDLSWYYN